MALKDEGDILYKAGKSESEIIATLKNKGYASESIEAYITEANIKRAVSDTMPENDNMQPSMLNPASMAATNTGEQIQTTSSGQVPTGGENFSPQAPPQQYQPQYPQEQYQQQDYQYPAQQQYDYSYQNNLSQDTISEIAESIVSEKLSSFRTEIERTIDMRTTFEAHISSIDDRLKRVEKIIDRLQLSVLQKVGEYVTNVEDIKKEMIQTQSTFKALLERNSK